MTAREMHYDFKQKLNKVDSQKYANLLVPEIDWKLNEAQELFIKMIAMPRAAKEIGFETNQRTIDDIRTIVVDQRGINCITPTNLNDGSYRVSLPTDYLFYLTADVLGTKSNCVNIPLKFKVIQHDDEDELSEYDKSSFEWRAVNGYFNQEGIRVFTDKTFSINKFCLSYIRKPLQIHNAQDYVNGTYTTMTGTVLTGFRSCELAEHTHREIVDIAVLLTAGEINLPDYQIKLNKLKLNN